MTDAQAKGAAATGATARRPALDPRIGAANLAALQALFDRSERWDDFDLGWLLAEDGVGLAHTLIPARVPAFANVLILHGATMRASDYILIGNFLASKGLNVIAQDRRGHGYSQGRSGHIDHTDRFADDVTASINALTRGGASCVRNATRAPGDPGASGAPDAAGLPLFLLTHSAGTPLALKAYAKAGAKAMPIAGIAMISPTFSERPGLMRRKPGWFRKSTLMRLQRPYRLRPGAPSLSETVDGMTRGTTRFNFRRYAIARIFGTGRDKVVATIVPARKDSVPFDYTTTGIMGYAVEAFEETVGALRCPVMLATGSTDVLVDVEAVQMTLGWLISPDLRYTTIHVTADHMATLPMVGRELLRWFEAESERA